MNAIDDNSKSSMLDLCKLPNFKEAHEIVAQT